MDIFRQQLVDMWNDAAHRLLYEQPDHLSALDINQDRLETIEEASYALRRMGGEEFYFFSPEQFPQAFDFLEGCDYDDLMRWEDYCVENCY
jgi:hypothetical protein